VRYQAADSGAAIVQEDMPPVPPLLQSFYPKKEVPGTLVTLKGQHLLTTATVHFNDLEAAFTVVSDEQIQATVPANATTGKITLVTAGGSVKSSGSFRVRQPGLNAFLPGQARVGATVFLAGQRLATTREIYFNGVKALDFNVVSDWALIAAVPPGATTGKVRVVLAGGGKATSKYHFVITQVDDPGLEDLKQARSAIPARAAGTRELPAPQLLAYPNPIDRQLEVSITLPQPQLVLVRVFDLLGREVSVLYQGRMPANRVQQLRWQPASQLPNGLYLVRLQAPGQDIQKKILLYR
jgi:hypothetical protein